MSALPATAMPAMPENVILCGDALDVLRSLPDNSVDALVTDPPAGIHFMSKHWDSDKGGRDAWIAWLAEIMREAQRVTKPGGHALVWALPRTSHWTAMALEDAGWDVRDRIAHINGQGFPKSLDVGKAIDRMAGEKRSHTKTSPNARPNSERGNGLAHGTYGKVWDITAPATDAARQWDGWGTSLKPAVEDWWLCRKPLSEKNVAANVLRWGTGALNIGASRVESGRDYHDLTVTQGVNTARTSWAVADVPRTFAPSTGRFPANLLLSHSIWCTDAACADGCPVRALDAQSGVTKSSDRVRHNSAGKMGYHGAVRDFKGYGFNDTGGASRYFQTFRYQAKASRAERNRGCEDMGARRKSNYAPNDPNENKLQTRLHGSVERTGNHHPTVKSLQLMSWLITLITPPGGIVLDCFAGSGSTLVAAKAGGWRYIGIEREAEYVAIARARLGAAPSLSPASAASAVKPKRARKPKKKAPQLHLLEEVSA